MLKLPIINKSKLSNVDIYTVNKKKTNNQLLPSYIGSLLQRSLTYSLNTQSRFSNIENESTMRSRPSNVKNKENNSNTVNIHDISNKQNNQINSLNISTIKLSDANRKHLTHAIVQSRTERAKEFLERSKS